MGEALVDRLGSAFFCYATFFPLFASLAASQASKKACKTAGNQLENHMWRVDTCMKLWPELEQAGTAVCAYELWTWLSWLAAWVAEGLHSSCTRQAAALLQLHSHTPGHTTRQADPCTLSSCTGLRP